MRSWLHCFFPLRMRLIFNHSLLVKLQYPKTAFDALSGIATKTLRFMTPVGTWSNPLPGFGWSNNVLMSEPVTQIIGDQEVVLTMLKMRCTMNRSISTGVSVKKSDSIQTFQLFCLNLINPLSFRHSAECQVSQWSEFGPCSVPCGRGNQMRTRSYVSEMKAMEYGCRRKLKDTTACFIPGNCNE